MLKNLWWQQGPLMEEEDDNSGGGGKGSKKGKEENSDDNDQNDDDSEDSDDEESDDDEDEDEDNNDENDDEELDDAALKEAKNLYKLIKNPASQKQAIEILARSAGIELGGGKVPETKKDSEKAAKKTVEYLEEALGENLKWLAPKLAQALDKIREEDRAENQKSLESLKQSQVEKEVDQAYAELRRETKGQSAKFENRMVVLADKLLPAPGMSVVEYVRHLYTIASATGESKSAKQRLAEKINRNSKDAPGRLRDSSSDGGGQKSKNDSATPMTALEAVQAAAKKLGY